MSVWRIRDVDGATRAQAQAAADKAGIPVAAWVERAIMRRVSQPDAAPGPSAMSPGPSDKVSHDTVPGKSESAVGAQAQDIPAAPQRRRKSSKTNKTPRPRKTTAKSAPTVAFAGSSTTTNSVMTDAGPDREAGIESDSGGANIATEAGPHIVSPEPPSPAHAIAAAPSRPFDTEPTSPPRDMTEQHDSHAESAGPTVETAPPREILLAHATSPHRRPHGRPVRHSVSLFTLGLGLVGIAAVGAAGYFLFLADGRDADDAPPPSPPQLASNAPAVTPSPVPVPLPVAPPQAAAVPSPVPAPAPIPIPLPAPVATPAPPTAATPPPMPKPAIAPQVATASPRDVPTPIPGVQPSLLTDWPDASPAADAPPPAPDAMEKVSLPTLVKRANGGDVRAQMELGKRYMEGSSNTTPDAGEALHWLLKAAEAGDTQAQFNVGVMYERGIGTAADLAKAAQWYRKATDRPIPQPTALHNLALLYIKGGNGMAADPAQARALMTRAAEMGQAQSQYSLALMYFQGVGGASDPVMALSWLALAARSDNPQYIKAAQELAGALNAEQKNKAQQLANQHVTRINETITRLRALANADTPDPPTATPASSPRSSPPAAAAPTPDKSSTTNAADQPLDHAGIAETQKLLIRLKFYSGKADGKSGPKTAQAIREYQKMAGLPADGKATVGLLTNLRDVAGAVNAD